MTETRSEAFTDEWSAGDLGCGELLIQLSTKIKALESGQLFKLIAQDPGAAEDMPAWCRMTGHSHAGSALSRQRRSIQTAASAPSPNAR
jgi:tRNA 2-thiouridine synthesizing protein A